VNEQELHRVLVRVVPQLPPPEDRVAAVIERARRRQRNIVSVAAALVVGIVVLGGVPLVQALAGRPLNNPPGLGNPTASPTPRADSVLETPGCAGYQPGMATEDQGTPIAPNQTPPNMLARHVMLEAVSRFGDVFASAEIRDGRVRLNRKPSREFDAWIMRDFAGQCLEIADAKASQNDMQTWVGRIDFRYWRDQGIEIHTVVGNPVDGVIVLRVAEDDLARAQKEIPKMYPDLPIRVEQGEPIVPAAESAAPSGDHGPSVSRRRRS
jgi:hypothetical protein